MFSKQLNGKCQLILDTFMEEEKIMSKKQQNQKSICVLSVFAVMAFGAVVQAGFVGTSQYEDCLRTDTSLDCSPKMSVTIPISYGLLKEFTLEPSGVFFQITKTAPVLIYPLRYLHTVPYYPREKVTRSPHPLSGCGSIDCNDPNGFSIARSLLDLEGTFGSCLYRGEELFGEPATMQEPYCTKHALDAGQVYYHGYEISEYIKKYQINIYFVVGSEAHTIKLSPDSPIYSTFYDLDYSGSYHCEAELIGDMDLYRGALELDNYILYVPASDGYPNYDDQYNMLLVPREEVTKDGTEIDKVGISKYSFKKLKSDYTVSEAGDGLANQLFQKHNSDLQKLAIDPDAETTYLVHGMRDFKDAFDVLPPMTLKHQINDINNSLVKLVMDQSALKYNKVESEGIIVSASIDDFSSRSEDGTLEVTIKNVGPFRTDYIVTATKPTMNIVQGTPAQARVLSPGEEATLKFDISTNFDMVTTNEVLASLRSSYGKLYDEVFVRFDTTKHPSTEPQELMMKNEGTEVELPADPNAPVITLNGSDPVTLNCGDTYVEEGATAIDDVDGPVPVTIGGDTVDTSTIGTYIVTYTAQDSACNMKQETRTVDVIGPCPEPLVGDNDNDGDVDLVDFGRMAHNWLEGTTP